MKSTPIVSVVVPTKNSERTLRRCLKSIQSQDYTKIEVIVVDNFSSDSTPQIAEKFASHFYSKGPERCTQRNYGVSSAKGQYVAIIDSDMYLSKQVISQALKKLANPDVAGVTVPEVSIGVGFWSKCKSLERSFYVDQPFMQAARIFRKEDYQKVGGYDETLISGEDWDLSQRIEKLGTLIEIGAIIKHDEGKISLLTTIRKKFYYSKHFSRYLKKNQGNTSVASQTNIFKRYALFFSKPSVILNSPLLFIGMLFMKTLEFAFGGLGLVIGRAKDKYAPNQT